MGYSGINTTLGYPGITHVKLRQTEISQDNLRLPSLEISLAQKIRYPKINEDNMVYAGFRVASRDIQDPPEAQSARASPDTHYEKLMLVPW